MSEQDGFLSRWSRRKAQVRSGEAVPEPPVPAAPAVAAAVAVPTAASVPTDAPAPTVPEPPPLTLDDAAALTPQSDFKPFVARAVDPQVRNAAMKTLFSDPHFNVMDGLDIYIDDYSQPNPLPLELARKLTSAQFMKVFDAPEPPPEPPPEARSDALPGSDPAVIPTVAQAPHTVSGDVSHGVPLDPAAVPALSSTPPPEPSA